MRRSTLWLVVSVASSALLGACNAIWGIDAPVPPTGNADAASDGTAIDAAVDRSITDAHPDTNRPVDAPSDVTEASCVNAPHDAAVKFKSCPDTTAPPKLLFVQGPIEGGVVQFCIDATEVTYSEYGVFYESGAPPQMPCECAWKDGHVSSPLPGLPTERPDYPVTNVDWCDAYAYCHWAGKRICGAIGGGPVPWEAGATLVDERYTACSVFGLNKYPYGSSFALESCNVAGAYGDMAVTETALDENCVTYYDGFKNGLVNMVGNVEEWQDSCSGTEGAKDMCLMGAGAFDTPADAQSATCGYLDYAERKTKDYDIGIRCCWP